MEQQQQQIKSAEDYIKAAEDFIKLQGEQIATYQELVKLQKERINNLDEQAKYWKRMYANAQWIAIFEFLALFTESKGEIANSSYVRSAFENIDITLTEDEIMKMAEYAQKHFERDAEYTKQMQAKGGAHNG